MNTGELSMRKPVRMTQRNEGREQQEVSGMGWEKAAFNRLVRHYKNFSFYPAQHGDPLNNSEQKRQVT